jgi:hypothetical protein
MQSLTLDFLYGLEKPTVRILLTSFGTFRALAPHCQPFSINRDVIYGGKDISVQVLPSKFVQNFIRCVVYAMYASNIYTYVVQLSEHQR